MKNVLLAVPGVVVTGLLVWGVYAIFNESVEVPAPILVPEPAVIEEKPPVTPENTTYVVDGEPITLVNGLFEHESAPGSASRDTFRLFGEPVYGDLDGDGDNDAVAYLTKDGGGSGTFFYVVVARNEAGSYAGTDALFLGDRIAPQNVIIEDGNAVANFAERAPGEDFSVQPSMGKSVWVHVDPKTGAIGELVKDFEGEADPLRMTLGMKVWTWVESENGEETFIPRLPDAFTLTFGEDGSVSITTDCNSMGGSYKAEGGALTFGPLMSTKKFCVDSDETVFAQMLAGVTAYRFTGKGELLLTYGASGTATFR